MKNWRWTLLAALLAFSTYFCMYAFRKPFAAGSYAGETLLGLQAKTLFVISQVVGYAASKYIGISWVSAASRASRLARIVWLIAAAEVALVAFAILPTPLKSLAILCNGLPLGMIWSLVVQYLEGRRESDLLLAALSCSFIVASGIVKDVGRWLLALGVPEYWMPAATGLLFFAPLVVSARMLDQVPEPSERDRLARERRDPMSGADRRSFARTYLPGLSALLLVYLALTAFRDFRDNYGVELFRALGYEGQPGLFTMTELPIALLVLVLMAGLTVFESRRSGLLAVFAVMTAGIAVIGASTLLLRRGHISGQVWMILSGLGAYLAYVPFSSFLFDRIMAATCVAGTAAFAVNLADAVGYTGSVGLQLLKDLGASGASRLDFFTNFSLALSATGCLLLPLTAAYFLRRSPPAQRAC